MNAREFSTLRKSVTTPYGEIAYAEKGSGPAALFVHGVLLNSYLWRNVVQELADERRCVARFWDQLSRMKSRGGAGSAGCRRSTPNIFGASHRSFVS
jgi:pimeloyl-ACP methyl ester carboxylesterase